jgi:hypothetical protein
MVMGILTLMGNLPRTGCVFVTVSKTWKKKFRKSRGSFIINTTETLPYLKISHETNFFGKSTMQISHFWKIYHAKYPFLENLP